MADVSDQAEQMGRRAENSEWTDRAVRVGMVAYGIVHLTIAWLAIQLATGNSSGSASRNGALHQLAQQPFGKFIVWVVAIGMLLLVLWKLLEAYVDHQNEDGAKAWLKVTLDVGKAIVYGTLGVSAFHTATGSKSSNSATSMTSKLMDQPFGRWLVGLVGLAIIGYGVYLIYDGYTEKFLKHLDAEGKRGDQGKAFKMFGKVGYIAKGVALGAIGALFIFAAVDHKAKKSGGLDQALHKVLQQPFGPVLLFAIAVGIGCYGLFCFARARHLSASR
jgi:NADH:ubiquinone oxidoreductase subunit 6 (subunit J)